MSGDDCKVGLPHIRMSEPPVNDRHGFGLSVDVGTSTITIHLIDITKGIVIDEIRVSNPQNSIGFDIVSRAKFSTECLANRQHLTNLVRNVIRDMVHLITDRNSVLSKDVDRIVIVGNTVMHHLFFDLPVDSLLEPPFHAKDKQSIEDPARDLHIIDNMETTCYSPPIVESFIGPDAISMILASGLVESKKSALAVDVGTNTEVAVIKPDGIWLASAASGSAFEGISLECGLPAKEGAIDLVWLSEVTEEPEYRVIGDVKPRGICGTGAISALALLLRTGMINKVGSFFRDLELTWIVQGSSSTHFILASSAASGNQSPIYLSQIDIRILQESKAAIAAAVEHLLDVSATSRDDISEFYLTGAFGSSLSLGDATVIGLFPSFHNARVVQSSGGAIAGADKMVINPNLHETVEEILDRINYVDLMENASYENLFQQARFFKQDD